MKKSVILVTSALLSVSTISFAASMQSLTKEQINQTFQDKTLTTVSLITLNNKLINNNSLTAYMSKDGKVTGHLANKPDTSDPQDDTGTWMVKPNGSLCVTWAHWNNNKQLCINVYSFNNSVVFINQQGNLESLALKDDIKTGNQMTNMPTTGTTTTTGGTPAEEATPAGTTSSTTTPNSTSTTNM